MDMREVDEAAMRSALALVRAQWQDDAATFDRLYGEMEDCEEVLRAMSVVTHQTLERLAGVAGISMGEMFHRMATLLVPRPEGAGGVVDVDGLGSR